MGLVSSRSPPPVVLLKHSTVKSLSLGVTSYSSLSSLDKSANNLTYQSFQYLNSSPPYYPDSPPASPMPGRTSYRLSQEFPPVTKRSHKVKKPKTNERASSLSSILFSRNFRQTSSSSATLATGSTETCHKMKSDSQVRRKCRRRSTKINFEKPRPAQDLFRTERLPSQVTDLLVFLAREGATVPDLFRRSGSFQDIKRILRRLRLGVHIEWSEYSLYTLACVTKRFLLCVEGGIFGPQAELDLIHALQLPNRESCLSAMHSVIMSLRKAVQHLLVMLFGTWFRMVYHNELNSMSLEAVSKSVTGSLFVNSSTTLESVAEATNVVQFIIANFPSSALFGTELLHYFAHQTKTSIAGVERFQYTYQYPITVPRQQCIREFVRILKQESDRYGFDLIRDVVSEEVFQASEESCTVLLETCENVPSLLAHTSAPSEGFASGCSPLTATTSTKEPPEIARDSNLHFNTEDGFFRRLIARHDGTSIQSLSEPLKHSSIVNLHQVADCTCCTSTDSLYRYIQQKQVDRMKERSHWFQQQRQHQQTPRRSMSEEEPMKPAALVRSNSSSSSTLRDSTRSRQHYERAAHRSGQCRSMSPGKISRPPNYMEETVYFVVHRCYGSP